MPGYLIRPLLLLLTTIGSTPCYATGLPMSVPLTQQSSGSLFVAATINGSAPAQFLLDTGSGLLVINRALFKQIAASNSDGMRLRKVARVAVRLADGRRRTVDTYQADALRIGNCELGDIRLAVVPGADRNILGLNALAKAGSFTVSLEPPTLRLANCGLSSPQDVEALAAIP